jgi:hypothetical protein
MKRLHANLQNGLAVDRVTEQVSSQVAEEVAETMSNLAKSPPILAIDRRLESLERR